MAYSNIFKTHNWLRTFVVAVIIFTGLNLYFFNNYKVANPFIERISVIMNVKSYEPKVYSTNSNEFNYNNPIWAKVENEKFVFEVTTKTTRNFKLYTGTQIDTGYIKEIVFDYSTGSEKIPVSDFKTEGIKLLNVSGDSTHFKSEVDGFFELKKVRITPIELIIAECLSVFLSLLLAFLIVSIFKQQARFYITFLNVKLFIAGLFVASFYLPIPTSNILVLASILLSIWVIDFRMLFDNKLGFIIIIYFLYFLMLNTFVSEEFNLRLFETLLPFLFMPLFFASIPKANYLSIVAISAFFYSLYFISTSIIDLSIYHTLTSFSFNNFTKFVHPVYFSYLLVFSLIYFWYNPNIFNHYRLIWFILIFALVCCGSKLMLGFCALFYAIHFFRKRLLLGVFFLIFISFSIFIFSPTRNRFKEIFNTNSLSILRENPIQSRFDERLNGLTIRLIIWDESIKALKGPKELFFGKGFDKSADDYLKNQLIERGVEPNHTKYDPHNQFITTFYKFGLIGLLILFSILSYCFYLAWKYKNQLLLWTTLLFLTSMLTESVWQRIIGIYLFITILLLQTSFTHLSKLYFENSNTRH